MDLNKSVYSKDGRLKTCPKCSVRARKRVYKPLAEFGDREMDDTTRIQSWCTECRKGAGR